MFELCLTKSQPAAGAVSAVADVNKHGYVHMHSVLLSIIDVCVGIAGCIIFLLNSYYDAYTCIILLCSF